MKKLKKEVKGITLVTLVVTIIVLLILAGIAINLTIGDDGLISRAKRATEEYENAARRERNALENLYSSIKVATDDDAEITINMKDLKELMREVVNEEKNKVISGVNANSVLMDSRDTTLATGERNLKNFTNSFTEGEFAKYFQYDEANGRVICKQEGLFAIRLTTTISTATTWTAQALRCKVNNINIVWTWARGDERYTECQEADCCPVYLKEGDYIELTKTTSGSAASATNTARFMLMKM